MFTKPMLEAIRKDISIALEDVKKKHKIMLTLGNISFDQNQFKASITGISSLGGGEDSASVTNAKYASEFFGMATLHGLKKSDLGRKFITRGGKTLSLIGGRSRAKLPLIGKDDSGDMFQVSVDEVLSGFTKYDEHKAPTVRPTSKTLEHKPTGKGDPETMDWTGPTPKAGKLNPDPEHNKNLKYDPKAVAHFKKNATKFGLTPAWFAKPFTLRGKDYTIAGSEDISGTTYIIGRDENGKDRPFKLDSVLKGL